MDTHSHRCQVWSLVGIAVLAISIGLSATAHASQRIVSVSESVSAAGLDLATPEGARALYKRLQLAARDVCSGRLHVGLEPPQSYTGCFEDALASAVRSIALPKLTMVYLRSHSAEIAEAHGIQSALLVREGMQPQAGQPVP